MADDICFRDALFDEDPITRMVDMCNLPDGTTLTMSGKYVKTASFRLSIDSLAMLEAMTKLTPFSKSFILNSFIEHSFAEFLDKSPLGDNLFLAFNELKNELSDCEE